MVSYPWDSPIIFSSPGLDRDWPTFLSSIDELTFSMTKIKFHSFLQVLTFSVKLSRNCWFIFSFPFPCSFNNLHCCAFDIASLSVTFVTPYDITVIKKCVIPLQMHKRPYTHFLIDQNRFILCEHIYFTGFVCTIHPSLSLISWYRHYKLLSKLLAHWYSSFASHCCW